MGAVTATLMSVVTKQSGHGVTPCAVSVCTTPAAPSPVPVPYPVTSMAIEGLKDTPSRTKINGVDCGNVGSCFTACHGNEPGTLKETCSLNTGGPSFFVAGSPAVFIERGMAAITTSPVFLNKGKAG